MWWYLWTAAAGALLSLLLYRRRHQRNLCGKLAVITGGDSGAGLHISRGLAARGARVIIAGENRNRGSIAAVRLASETGADVEYRYLNLASLHSIHEFADDLRASERKLEILVNNAAVTQLDNSMTEDNMVVEMQINYFGPYLLTNLLLPLMKQAKHARIINASSVMHYLGNINVNTLADKARDKHAHKRVFANSTLCNILFTRELSRHLAGTKITVNCFHPGVVDKDPVEQLTSCTNYQAIIRHFLSYIYEQKHPDEATTALWLATSPVLATFSGKYFVDCQETKPSKVALDNSLAEKLWTTSTELVKLN